MKAPIVRPELVSVYECPAWEGVTVGQLLERMYADFALDLAKRKLEGTLDEWVRARLNEEHLKTPPWSIAIDYHNNGASCNPAVRDWLTKHLGLKPKNVEDLSEAHILLIANCLELLLQGDMHLCSDSGHEEPYLPIIDTEIILGNNANMYSDESLESTAWDWLVGSKIDNDILLPVGLELAKLFQLVPHIWRWDLITRLMPHAINQFCQGEVPPLPRDLMVPVWDGVVRKTKPSRSIEDAAQSYQYALGKEPTLGDGKPKAGKIYDWLKKNGTQKGYDLPSKETWERYIREAEKCRVLKKPRQGKQSNS